MLERILVALDSPENNSRLIVAAIALAKITNARLLLVHVAKSESVNTFSNAKQACIDKAITNDLEPQDDQGSTLKKLRSLYSAANAVGVSADIAQPLGNAGQRICESAHQWGADLIMLGRRDSLVDPTPLCSVSQYVTGHASCPTIVMQNQSCEDFVAETSAMSLAAW